ncbi:YfcE family phosphodiesterase [Thermocladium modestius]|nr:YfcE family phosphodiesterase [Thermocladium modestius]
MGFRRALIVGDTHVPDRAGSIPRQIVEALNSMKPFDYVLITGDLISGDVLEELRGFGEKSYAVRGNMDSLELPDKEVIKIEGMKVGLMHGHQIRRRGDVDELTKAAVKLGVDVLVSGHTHEPAIMRGAVNLLNPGSLTGAWSGGGARSPPSFLVLEAGGASIEVSLFQLIGEVKLTRRERVLTGPGIHPSIDLYHGFDDE